jgi:hypothetical protein
LKVAEGQEIPVAVCKDGFVPKIYSKDREIGCPENCGRIIRGEVTQNGLLTEKGLMVYRRRA